MQVSEPPARGEPQSRPLIGVATAMTEYSEAEKKQAFARVNRVRRQAEVMNRHGNEVRQESERILQDAAGLYYAAVALNEKYGLGDMPPEMEIAVIEVPY